MRVVSVQGIPQEEKGSYVLAIGKFDGVHIGHQAILHQARSLAHSQSELAVVSFTPHPVYVLTGDERYRTWLTPERDKSRLLEQFGVEALFLIQFDAAYANVTAETFVREHLRRLGAKSIVVGADFRFGRGGQATVEDLKGLASTIQVPVHVVHHVEENGVKVSSSNIRDHLLAGRVEAAEALLGRAYSLTGVVEHGDARGRTIGFPTANIGGIDDYVLPKNGVYAVSVDTSVHEPGRNWFGVANLGIRPTVNGLSRRLEVHLLDYSGDLYGKQLRVSLLRRLRDEMKFASLSELTQQIRQDCLMARIMLGLSSLQE
ncbi:MAG: bifunctional riboflavin kinase/FAD synthetase [Alicyclobacillaceae bacterium]|nr:bifunctional riboflavin kinase/FAD synthetase [Alicyclobacillaceae bacterium]